MVEIYSVEDFKEFSKEKGIKKIVIQNDREAVSVWSLEAGTEIPLHKHPNQDDVWYVVEGKGVMTLGEEKIKIESKNIIRVPPETFHGAKADDKLVIISTLIPGKA